MLGAAAAAPPVIAHAVTVNLARVLKLAGRALTPITTRLPVGPRTIDVLTHSGFMLPVPDPEGARRRRARVPRRPPSSGTCTSPCATSEHGRVSLSRIEVPAAFVAAKWDVLAGSRDMASAAARIPDATYVELRGSHFVQMEQPERVHQLLLEFLGPGRAEVPRRPRPGGRRAGCCSAARSPSQGGDEVDRANGSNGPGSPADSPRASARPTVRVRRQPAVVGTVATGLAVPWGLAFLPDGDALVTERDTATGAEHRRARPRGHRGGHASATRRRRARAGCWASPSRRRSTRTSTLYFYLSTARDNRIVTATPHRRAARRARHPILTGIPVGPIHDGGRLAFGPDGLPLRLHRRDRRAASSPRTGTRSAARSCGSPPTASPRPATRSAPRSGPSATATCRAWPSTTTASCGPRSSARTPSTS